MKRSSNEDADNGSKGNCPKNQCFASENDEKRDSRIDARNLVNDHKELAPVYPSAPKYLFGIKTNTLNNFFINLKSNVKVDARNILEVEKPDLIIFRLFDVISSWEKHVKELIHFNRFAMLGFLKKVWHEPFVLQLVDELRIQALNDNRVFTDSPIINKWTSPATYIQSSVYQYVMWRLTVDGGLDVGRHTLPHNQMQKLFWQYLYKSNKLQLHVYSDVANSLKKMKKKSKCFLHFIFV